MKNHQHLLNENGLKYWRRNIKGNLSDTSHPGALLYIFCPLSHRNQEWISWYSAVIAIPNNWDIQVREFRNGWNEYRISFGKGKCNFKIYQWTSFQPQVQINSTDEDRMQYENAYKSGQLYSEKGEMKLSCAKIVRGVMNLRIDEKRLKKCVKMKANFSLETD